MSGYAPDAAIVDTRRGGVGVKKNELPDTPVDRYISDRETPRSPQYKN